MGLNRRTPALGRRSGRGAARKIAAPAITYGLRDFGGADDRLQSAVDQGITGDVAGFWFRLLHVVLSQGASATRRLVWNSSGGNGFYYFTSGANALLEGVVVVTGVVSLQIPGLTITAGMVGTLLDTTVVWDPISQKLSHYFQGVKITAGTSSALAYLPPTGRRMTVGMRDNGTTPADANLLCGMEGGDGFIPSESEVLAAHNSTKARVALNQPPLAGISGKTTWRANQVATWNPPVIWDDEVGSEDLTMVVGSASGLTVGSVSGVFASPL